MEKFKFNDKKLDKKEVCQALHDSLEFLIEANNSILVSFDNEDFEGIEEIEFDSIINQKMIELYNKTWDSQIVKEKEKCLKEIQDDDLNSIIKDVNTSLSLQEKTMKMIFNQIQQANNSGDERYSLEMLRYVKKVLQDSNEIFNYQLDYSNKQLQNFSENQ